MIKRRSIINPFLSGSFRNNVFGTASYGNDLTNFVISGSFIGNFIGTASYALNAPTLPSVSASYALSASYANNAISASYAPSSPSVSASYATSASYAVSASYAPSSPSVSASYAVSASYTVSASYAKNIEPVISSSYALSASNARNSISSSYVLSSSYSSIALSSSYILTSSYANKSLTASYAENTAPIISASYALSSSYTRSALSASYSNNALTSSYSLISNTASYALNSNLTNNVNNCVITATGGSELNGEVNLTFDGTILKVPSINTGTNINGTIFAQSTNQISLTSSTHAFTAGGESNDHNLILGKYGTGTGIQSRNNGLIGALHLNPYSGDVRVGDSIAGVQNFTIFNKDSGTGSFVSFEARNNAGSANDAFRIGLLSTGFNLSGMNLPNAGVISTEVNISNGLSIGTKHPSGSIRFYTNNANKRIDIANNGVTTFYGNVVLNAETGSMLVSLDSSKILRSINLTGHITSINNTTTLDKTSVTSQSTVTLDNADYILISDSSDSGSLKKVIATDFGGGGLTQQQIEGLI